MHAGDRALTVAAWLLTPGVLVLIGWGTCILVGRLIRRGGYDHTGTED